MSDRKPSSRKALTVIIGIVIVAVIVVIVASSTEYWTDKREPVGVTEGAR